MRAWQVVHRVPNARWKPAAPFGLVEPPAARLTGDVGEMRALWKCISWHCRQRNGSPCLSRLLATVPWGSWQVMQLSSTGACSNMKGPCFAEWQVAQRSFVRSAVRSRCSPGEPCVSWQELHVMRPSRTG